MNKFKINLQRLVKAPLLCGFALLNFVIGVSFFYIEQQFSYLAIGLTVISGVAFLLSFCLIMTRNFGETQSDRQATIFNPKGWKKLAIIICIIAGSLAFIVGSNYLANTSSIRWDVTQDKQHTLSENTLEYISSLTSEVQLTAFYVGLPPKYLEDLFNEYARASNGVIKTEIIDPFEKIAYAAKFGNAINGKERKVIVQSGDNRKDLDFTKAVLPEEKLTNGIAQVSRTARKAYFLAGHGEYSSSSEEYAGLSKFKQLLADNNILSESLMLGISQSIPTDCDVLIIAGPRNELTPNEETLISRYLTKGGDALFLIENTLVTTPDKPLSPQQLQQNPSLNSLLNPWGLNVQSDIVVDLTNHVGGDVGSPATKNYQQHKALTEGLDYTFYVRPRSIRILGAPSNIKHAVIASTASADNSWAETDRTLNIEFDPNIDTKGPVPFSYVVLGEKNTEIQQEHKSSDTRLIVFTDADFLTNVYIDQYSNAQMGLNLINWLVELDYQTLVNQKEIKVERLDLTSKQKRQIIVILFLLPFLLVVTGLVIWLRAKAVN
ncbi:GldG family protein [Paraglaciecola sp.]|uniref:GldG family protein n=1 Tax=Paraglaciecola sp. TaxID=1920173 RepID=UPI003EF20D57